MNALAIFSSIALGIIATIPLNALALWELRRLGETSLRHRDLFILECIVGIWVMPCVLLVFHLADDHVDWDLFSVSRIAIIWVFLIGHVLLAVIEIPKRLSDTSLRERLFRPLLRQFVFFMICIIAATTLLGIRGPRWESWGYLAQYITAPMPSGAIAYREGTKIVVEVTNNEVARLGEVESPLGMLYVLPLVDVGTTLYLNDHESHHVGVDLYLDPYQFPVAPPLSIVEQTELWNAIRAAPGLIPSDWPAWFNHTHLNKRNERIFWDALAANILIVTFALWITLNLFRRSFFTYRLLYRAEQKRRLLRRINMCANCGYSRRGAPSEICPECGQ